LNGGNGGKTRKIWGNIAAFSGVDGSYFVKKFFASLGRIFNVLCGVAFFINIWLFGFANMNNMFDLSILSLLNMILLTFVLLRETEETNE
tara:strand:+ start:61 stop:330 length:270 start_codon:yes stop_codon:yes gene_type:complete